MKALVTGGTGYVGRFIAEGLLGAGYEVVVAGRTPPEPGFFSRDVEFRPLRLAPDEIEEPLFAGMDHLVHAAFRHVPGKYRGGEGDDPVAFRRANLDASVRLFELARAAGIERCVFLSSRAVYGTQPPGALLAEETEPHPDTLYGEVKREAEQALAAMASLDFVAASLRVTGVYGPAGPGRKHKWADLFADYLAGRPIAPRVGTEVHGDDVAAAVRLVLEGAAEAVNAQVFNVSDILVDRRDLLWLLKDASGCLHSLPARGDGTGYNEMAADRLRKLGWRPGGIEKLKRTVEQLANASCSP